MSKQRVAAVLTVLVLAGAVGIAVLRATGWRVPPLRAFKASMFTRSQPAPPEPSDTIYAMLNAARAGDVTAYLAAYTGQMEADLRKSIAESGQAAFSDYLVQSNAEVKGVAVSEPKETGTGEVSVRVEYIYQDRNQAQWMYLEKGASAWRISRTETEERVKTLVPYGTPLR